MAGLAYCTEPALAVTPTSSTLEFPGERGMFIDMYAQYGKKNKSFYEEKKEDISSINSDCTTFVTSVVSGLRRQLPRDGILFAACTILHFSSYSMYLTF